MTTIKRILCPIDFSEASRHAIENALAIARWFQASVSVLHVHRPADGSTGSGRRSGERASDAAPAQLRMDTAAWVEAASPHGVVVEVVFRTGQPVHDILDLAASLRADLIVIGTHGVGGFEHLVLGSVTEKVLRRASCPVMTVPPRAHATSVLPFNHLLCAIDFSEASLAGLELAVSIAQEAGARLTILHVIEWLWEESPPPALQQLPPDHAATLAELRQYLTTSASGRLEGLVSDAVWDRCRIVPRVAHGKTYVQILRLAAEDRADLIVMGVRGRNAVDLTLFGSTTNQVVRGATCPVLTVNL